MDTNTKPQLLVAPLDGYQKEIGHWLWAMESTRRTTKQAIKDIAPEAIDWKSPHAGNTIGTLLYHIAVIEMDWLYFEVLEQTDVPDTIKKLFPFDVRDDQGNLTELSGVSIDEHLHRLDAMREIFLASFHDMSIEEFRRTRSLERYDVTPEWVIFHLVRHEAEHQGQIMQLRKGVERELDISKHRE